MQEYLTIFLRQQLHFTLYKQQVDIKPQFSCPYHPWTTFKFPSPMKTGNANVYDVTTPLSNKSHRIVYRRRSVLTTARAIVKLVHLNMNKTFSCGLARTQHSETLQPDRLAHPPARELLESVGGSGSQPNSGSVLRLRIYGLFNGGLLQIRRAVNQPSNGPHRARTMHGGHCCGRPRGG